MIKACNGKQFLCKYRMALIPSQGFQSAQYKNDKKALMPLPLRIWWLSERDNFSSENIVNEEIYTNTFIGKKGYRCCYKRENTYSKQFEYCYNTED